MTNAGKLLKKAQTDLQAGNAAKAEKHCRRLLKEKSVYLAVRLVLAKALSQQNRLKDAARYIKEAANHDTSNTKLQQAAADMLTQVGLPAEVLPFLERIVAAQPSNPDAWFELLSCMSADVISTNDTTNQSIGNEPSPVPPDLLQLAIKMLEHFPNSLKLITLIGEIFLADSQPDVAEKCFLHALSERPYIARAHYNWLKMHHESLDFDAILNYEKEHGEAVSQDALCVRTIAAAYENLGYFDKALEHLNVALPLCQANDAKYKDYLAARGRVHMHMGQFTEALEDLNTALSALPEFWDALHNRCLTNKCLGNIRAAAQDEFARLRMNSDHTKFDFKKPLWKGESLAGKKLFIWADMGIGDTFKYAPLIRELSKGGHIILAAQPKTLDFLRVVLPDIEIRSLPSQTSKFAGHQINLMTLGNTSEGTVTFGTIEEDFDYQIPLAGLYTITRPDLDSITRLTRAFSLPEATIAPYRKLECLGNPNTTKVGLAWSSKNINEKVARNYLSLEDLLPILRMPGFEFYNFQYSASEEEIRTFREKHSVPLYHAPGLDLMDDMLGTAAFNSLMDLFVSPANTCSDIAGTMGVKSYRADLVHLPESLGQDMVPWYEDQKSLKILWGKTVVDYIPDMQAWLEHNKDHRSKNRQP